MSKLKSNLIYNTVYQLLLIITPLITTPYVSRTLGAEAIGVYSYYYSIAYYFGMFILLGVNNHGNRAIAFYKDDIEKRSKQFISIYSLQIILFILLLSTYVFAFIPNSDDKVMSTIMILHLISVSLDINWFFFGLEEFKITVTRNIIIKIISIILIIVFIKSPTDLYLYAIIQIGSTLLSQLILLMFLRNRIKWVRITLSDVSAHIIPNIRLFIPVIMISIYNMTGKIMLGSFTDMYEVGLFESASRLTAIPLALINSFGTVMLPRTTNMVAKGKFEESLRYLNLSIVVVVALSSLVSLGIIGVTNEIVPIFFGDGFDKTRQLIPILVVSSIFISIGNVVRTQYLIPNNKDSVYLKSVTIGAITNVIVNLALIRQYQSIGVAIGALTAEFAVATYQLLAISKEVNLKKPILDSIPFVAIAIFMSLLIIPINNLEYIFYLLIEKIIIGALIYLPLSYLYLRKIRKKYY